MQLCNVKEVARRKESWCITGRSWLHFTPTRGFSFCARSCARRAPPARGRGGGIAAAAMDSRFTKVVRQVAKAFDLPEDEVKEAMSTEAHGALIGDFLGSAGPPRLVVGLRLPEGADPSSSEGGELFMSAGDDVRITGKSVLVVRLSEAELTTSNIDSEVMVGVIQGSPIKTLLATLQHVYLPALGQRTSDWAAKLPEESSAEFVGSVGKFVEMLDEAVTSLESGLELAKPRPTHDTRPACALAPACAAPASNSSGPHRSRRAPRLHAFARTPHPHASRLAGVSERGQNKQPPPTERRASPARGQLEGVVESVLQARSQPSCSRHGLLRLVASRHTDSRHAAAAPPAAPPASATALYTAAMQPPCSRQQPPCCRRSWHALARDPRAPQRPPQPRAPFHPCVLSRREEPPTRSQTQTLGRTQGQTRSRTPTQRTSPRRVRLTHLPTSPYIAYISVSRYISQGGGAAGRERPGRNASAEDAGPETDQYGRSRPHPNPNLTLTSLLTPTQP